MTVPQGVVTLTLETVPVKGITILTVASLTTEKTGQFTPLILTDVAPVKPEPPTVIVSLTVEVMSGDTVVTTGLLLTVIVVLLVEVHP